ncbi:patatin-like protein [Geodermatophilus sp. SYSU D00766]
MTGLPELRLALGMRGGVSLAVWMGGACSEVDRLRRAFDDEDGQQGGTATYRRILEASGYGSVAVDVVAGASAGGLNSVLMACSVVHGMRFDSTIRDLWLRLGDLGGLVRRGVRRPQSLLDGDRGFYGALAPELERLVEAAIPPKSPPRMDAVLTCTLFTPVARTRYQDLGPPIVERRNRAWFRFRNPVQDAAVSMGMGAGQQEDRTAALRRLAYAARTTSSFPGAFEPASVGFAPTTLGSVTPPSPPPTHYGSYSESRPADGRVSRDLVIDGGVLDNIPVAWAIRSIAAAPADRAVVRWLVYLQPVPFRPPPPPQDEKPDPVTTARRARELQGGTEALADDLDDLEQLRRDILRRQGYQQVLEYALGQLPEGQDLRQFLAALYDRALAAVETYRRRAGAMEANRVRALWTDPLPVLGADPLGFADVTRTPLAGLDSERLLGALDGAGPDMVLGDESLGGGAEALARLLHRFRSPQVLARTVAVLLDAARELGDDGLLIEAALYEVRQTIEVLVARADRALAAEPQRSRPAPGPAELARRAVWRPTNPGAVGWPDRADIWRELVSHAQNLAQAASNLPNRPRAFVGCLVGAAGDATDSATATAAVLAAVELLTGPLRPDPLAETSAIAFHMLSAQNQSPCVPAEPGQTFTVGDKLAGNQLGNFGAFLSARWRANDWTWGRLDAARSLVDIVTQPRASDEDRLPRLRAVAGLPATAGLGQVREELVRHLHEGILREELPVLSTLGDGPPQGELPGALPPSSPFDVEPLRQTGQETVRDLVKPDPRLVVNVTRLIGVSAYAATGAALARGARGLSNLLRRRPPGSRRSSAANPGKGIVNAQI